MPHRPHPEENPEDPPLTPYQRQQRERDQLIGKFSRLAYQAQEKANALRARSRECNKAAHHFKAAAARLARQSEKEELDG